MRLITLAFLSFLLLPCNVYSDENIRKITVNGKSEAVIEAQYAIIQLNIKFVKKEMNQSHNELLKTISQLSSGLINIGLTDTDIKKSLILQGQEYSWEKDTRVLKGYYSESMIELYVKNINKIADVYKELANYKSITIQGTDFRSNDEFSVRKAECEKALLAAKKKAEYMAQTLNVKIGKVNSIQEMSTEDNLPVNLYTYTKTRDKETSESKSGYGNIKITVLVEVSFQLE